METRKQRLFKEHIALKNATSPYYFRCTQIKAIVNCAKRKFHFACYSLFVLSFINANRSEKVYVTGLWANIFSVFKTECLFSFAKKFFRGYKCVMIDGNLQIVVQRTKLSVGFATGVP